jgi:hypothetical protein
MRWWPILLLAGCCQQPQPQYRQGVPPSVYVAPPSMYSTVLRRNKQGKLVRVQVRVPQPQARRAEPPSSAGESEPRSTEIWTSPDPKVQSDLNDLAERVEDLRRRMAREPDVHDVRQE